MIEKKGGWCSSCDSMWEKNESNIIDDREACPNCGDWLIPPDEDDDDEAMYVKRWGLS